MTGLVALLAALVAAVVLGTLWRRRQGVLRRASPGQAGLDPVLLAGMGVRLGERATLLQFSSAFCQPCRATRGVLAHAAGLLDGVEHVDVDAEAHLDAVRALGILRTPTTLVLDAAGRELVRAGGVPALADVLAVVGAPDPDSSGR